MFSAAVDLSGNVTKNNDMKSASQIGRPRNRSGVKILAAFWRCLLCLCLWNSPLPLLHAHEGAVQDEVTELARHLHDCHSRNREHCECWHLHMVLWGHVQSDQPAKSPTPRPVDDHSATSDGPSPILRSLCSVEIESHATDFGSIEASISSSRVPRPDLGSPRSIVSQFVALHAVIIRC